MGVMKICPKCGKTYADPSVAFCFNDGFPLALQSPEEAAAVSGSPPPAESAPPSGGAVALGAVPEPSVELPKAGLRPLPTPAPLPSNPTLMPMDLAADPADAVALGSFTLGELLAYDADTALFDVGQGKAAWIWRPDRPGCESFVKRAEAAKTARERGVLRIHQVVELPLSQGGALHFAVVDRPKGRNLAVLMSRLATTGQERLDAAEVLDLGCGLASAIAGLQSASEGVIGDLAPIRVWVNHDGRTSLLAGAGGPPPLPRQAELERWSVQAPELSMRRDQADGRADLYSLGAMLWSLLTARKHTLKSDWVRTVEATRGSAPLDLASPLHELLAQCMAAEPSKRPESAALLAKELDALRGTQRGSWGPKLLTAFPIGLPSSLGTEARELVDLIEGLCKGERPLPPVLDTETLDLPEWPQPLGLPPVSESDSAAERDLAPESGPQASTAAEDTLPAPAPAPSDTPSSKPEAPAAGMMDLVQKDEEEGTLEAVPPVSEEVSDDDSSLGGGFFAAEPGSYESAPLEDGDEDDGLPPPVPQRSWGPAIGGALLGLLLLGGGIYLAWHAQQGADVGSGLASPQPAEAGSAGVPGAGDEAASAQVEPLPEPEVEAEPVGEPDPVAEPEPEPLAEPVGEPEVVAPKPPPKGGGNRPTRGKRPKVAGGRRATPEPVPVPEPEPDPEPEGGWEASPWGEAGEQPKADKPASDGNPWGAAE